MNFARDFKSFYTINDYGAFRENFKTDYARATDQKKAIINEKL